MRIYLIMGQTPTIYKKKISAALLKVRKPGKVRKLNRLEVATMQHNLERK